MFGVVLWSDTQDRKAVIWCEDHGDLAYYRHSQAEADVDLDPGDWVQFDLTMDRHMRFAHNPRLVAEGVCDGLSETLKSATPVQNTQPTEPETRGSAEILPFSVVRRSSRTRLSPGLAAQLA